MSNAEDKPEKEPIERKLFVMEEDREVARRPKDADDKEHDARAKASAAHAAATFVKQRKCPHPKCRHIHAEGNPCHVFVVLPPAEQGNSSEEEDEEESESESEEAEEEEEEVNSDDDEPPPGQVNMAEMMRLAKGAGKGAKSGAKQAKEAAKRAAVAAAKAATRVTLEEPAWCRRAGFARCNCHAGVPLGDPKYWPVAQDRFAGRGELEVRINTAGEKPERGWHSWRPHCAPPPAALVPALGFVNPRAVARAACVGRDWRDAAAVQLHYADMHRFAPLATVQAHDRAVLAVATFRGFAYTSGDCSVRAWDVRALAPGGPDGNVPDAVTCRDTCDIACLLECDQALYCASANGALRQWSLPHDPTKAQFRAQMWLHNKVVNGAAHWHFGGESVLFTVCDDRECRAWNLRDNQCAHTIVPVDRTGGTLRSVAVSDQYLFLGSSNGQIFVYLTACGCRRTARHECVLPPGPSPFCLQATLRHGDRGTAAANPPVVSSLAVGGQHRQANRLFSGGHDGEVWVWSVPGEGNDFQLLQRLKGVHCGAVTAMVCGWSHLLTGGGDGCVRAFALYSLGWGRGGVQALERVQKVSGRVTCLHLDGSGDVEPDVDLLYVGTNRGQLVVFRLGAYI